MVNNIRKGKSLKTSPDGFQAFKRWATENGNLCVILKPNDEEVQPPITIPSPEEPLLVHSLFSAWSFLLFEFVFFTEQNKSSFHVNHPCKGLSKFSELSLFHR